MPYATRIRVLLGFACKAKATGTTVLWTGVRFRDIRSCRAGHRPGHMRTSSARNTAQEGTPARLAAPYWRLQTASAQVHLRGDAGCKSRCNTFIRDDFSYHQEL